MKKTFSLTVMALLAVSLVMPMVLATSVGTGIGVDIVTEDFPPQVWMCDSRVVSDDNVQQGRLTWDGHESLEECLRYSSYVVCTEELLERINNYAFEGESIHWKVLVLDKNGIEKIEDVFATIGDVQGEGNYIEANCVLDEVLSGNDRIDPSCGARILEENLTKPGYDNVAAYYDCTLTVETPESMYGEYWVTVEATDLDGLSGTMDENEYWFFNPEIRLSIDGDLIFEDVRPGTSSYSDTLLVGNDADDGSGVLMDMFISGTDFYDSSSSGAKCPTTNKLDLGAFKYFATNGAYSTSGDLQVDDGDYDEVVRARDAEGYLNIQYGDHWDKTMYDEAEILQAAKTGPYYAANVLAPGAETALTFKLNLPEPCNGDFDTGAIYFWGEAI